MRAFVISADGFEDSELSEPLRRLQAGRTATCYGGIAAELKAAGVDYRDRAVLVDGDLITSRKPADPAAFVQAIFELLGLGQEAVRQAAADQ